MAKYLDYITPSASFEEMAYVDQYFSDMISGEFFKEVALGLYETIKIPDTLHEMFERVHEAYLAGWFWERRPHMRCFCIFIWNLKGISMVNKMTKIGCG